MAQGSSGGVQQLVQVNTTITGKDNNVFNVVMPVVNFSQETKIADSGQATSLDHSRYDPWEEVTKPIFTKLVEKIDPMDIADEMYEKNLITDREFRGLRRRNEDPKLLREGAMQWLLIEVLPRKHKSSLKEFISILEKNEDTGLKELGEQLKEEYEKFKHRTMKMVEKM